MIIDTHCHYNLEPLFSNDDWRKVPEIDLEKENSEIFQKYGILRTKEDGWNYPVQVWQKYWEKAHAQEVEKSIVVGTDYHTSKIAGIIAQKDKNLFCSIGNHPMLYQEKFEGWEGYDFKKMEEWVSSEKNELSYDVEHTNKVVAIGETGLDYFRLPQGNSREKIIELQKIAFRYQINLALKINLPLIVHVRDTEVIEEKKEGNAYWDALKILHEQNVKNFVLHCASGPLSYIKQAVEMGGYMGFDGNITYPNAEHIRDIFKVVPEDRRVVETDAPYLPPQSHRGKTCEPWMIVETVEYIEQTFKVGKSSFYENSLRLFKLKNK